jgi:copper homeostasis protein
MIGTIIRLKNSFPKISGFVFGALTKDHKIDIPTTKALVEASQPHSTTFHRAFDYVLSPFQSLDELDALKIDRVLTSGRPGRAIDNLCILRHLVIHASSKNVNILIGGKVRADNAKELLIKTKASELHSSTPFELPDITSDENVASPCETPIRTSMESIPC